MFQMFQICSRFVPDVPDVPDVFQICSKCVRGAPPLVGPTLAHIPVWLALGGANGPPFGLGAQKKVVRLPPSRVSLLTIMIQSNCTYIN